MSRTGLLLGGVSAAAAGIVLYQVVFSGASPQPNDRFSGGGLSGYSNARFIQAPFVAYTSPARFSGGQNDGYAFIAAIVNAQIPYLPPARFSGGRSDGYHEMSLGILNDPRSPPSPRFSGGNLDGYSVQLLAINFGSIREGSERFLGGAFDGHAYIALVTSATMDLYSHRFRGGSFDGHATQHYFVDGTGFGFISPRYFGGRGDGHNATSVRIPAIVIMLDSDGDGIPDWWETMYFGGATSANPNSPVDASGMTALEKYIAGLTPGDPNSVFVISSVDEMSVVAEDPCMTFTWPTVPGRVYRVYANSDLNRDWPKEPAAEYFGDGKPVSFIHCDDGSIPLYFRLTVDFIAQ